MGVDTAGLAQVAFQSPYSIDSTLFKDISSGDTGEAFQTSNVMTLADVCWDQAGAFYSKKHWFSKETQSPADFIDQHCQGNTPGGFAISN